MFTRLFVFVCTIGIISCSTDFELTTGGKEQPVIYSILTEDDEYHYVRVEKLFVDEDTGPRELATDSNNVFYDNITVELIKNNQAQVLTKVNAVELGMPRDSGIFLSEPNYLYRVSDSEFDITAEDIVEVRVTLPSDTLVASATAPIVGKSELKSPSSTSTQIYLAPSGGTYRVRWDGDEDAAFYDLYFNLHIREISDNTTEYKELLWPIVTARKQDNYTVIGPEFFNFLEASLEPNPNVRRKLDSFDIVIDAGGEALERFIDINNLNTGITSSQVIPNYTNVNNGLGLFSSTSSVTNSGFQFHTGTIDSLRNNPRLQDLNFE